MQMLFESFGLPLFFSFEKIGSVSVRPNHPDQKGSDLCGLQLGLLLLPLQVVLDILILDQSLSIPIVFDVPPVILF
jgi:hypothetical protein